jgi:hypothetical protein
MPIPLLPFNFHFSSSFPFFLSPFIFHLPKSAAKLQKRFDIYKKLGNFLHNKSFFANYTLQKQPCIAAELFFQ